MELSYVETVETWRYDVDRESSPEDLGEDVLALVVATAGHGRASILRRINGVLVKVIVEAA